MASIVTSTSTTPSWTPSVARSNHRPAGRRTVRLVAPSSNTGATRTSADEEGVVDVEQVASPSGHQTEDTGRRRRWHPLCSLGHPVAIDWAPGPPWVAQASEYRYGSIRYRQAIASRTASRCGPAAFHGSREGIVEIEWVRKNGSHADSWNQRV